MTFDAVPPGAEPTRITPTAIAGSSPNTTASSQPASGMMRNCATTPTMRATGFLPTMAKSDRRSVMPMPSMMTMRRYVTRGPSAVNGAGQSTATAPATSTTSGNYAPAIAPQRSPVDRASLMCTPSRLRR